MVDNDSTKPHSLAMSSVDKKLMRLINLVANWYRHASVGRVSCFRVS
jgi:hypothetical protein